MSQPENDEGAPGEEAPRNVTTDAPSVNHYKAAEALLAEWAAARADHPNGHTRDLIAAVAHALLAVADEVDAKYISSGGEW